MAGNRQRQHASKIVSIKRKFLELKFRILDPPMFKETSIVFTLGITHTHLNLKEAKYGINFHVI